MTLTLPTATHVVYTMGPVPDPFSIIFAKHSEHPSAIQVDMDTNTGTVGHSGLTLPYM